MEEVDACITDLLNKCGIVCEGVGNLDGMVISRELLLNMENYENVQENITLLKTLFSSSSHTSLQSSAWSKQRWPLLNLIRQILKLRGYSLQPKRLSNGYDLNKKKQYKRVFIVSKD